MDVRSRRINTSIVEFFKKTHFFLTFRSSLRQTSSSRCASSSMRETASSLEAIQTMLALGKTPSYPQIRPLIRFVNDSGGVLERDMMTRRSSTLVLNGESLH
jgi:hypothetical protein